MVVYMKNSKGPMMNNGKGMYSYPDNPLQPAKRVAPMCGPGSNPDMMKANKLLQKTQRECDSLRGKSGM